MGSTKYTRTTLASIPRTCDRCSCPYTFMVSVAATQYGGTSRLREVIEKHIAWLSTHPEANATHGVVCPHCLTISRAAQARHFPEGYVQGIRKHWCRVQQFDQRFGNWLLIAITVLLACMFLVVLFLPAFVPFEDGDDVERMHQQTNKRHSPPTSVDPAMPPHPPQPDVASRSSPVAPQKLWIGAVIFTGFCALAIPFWAKVLYQRGRSRIDRTILLLADIDERDAEIYLIDAHQSEAGYESIIFFGDLSSLLPYLEMSVKDRARWFQKRQRAWEKERQELKDFHKPNPWLGEVAD